MNADTKSDSHADLHTDSLSKDLRFVFSRALPIHDENGPQAAIAGELTTIENAIEKAVDRVRSSVAPAIVGLGGLSIEAAEQAITLAEQLRAKLLPHPSMDPVQVRQRVSFHAGLAEAMNADLRVVTNELIQPGETGQSEKVLASLTLAVDERVPNALFMAVADIKAVVQLRQALAAEGVNAIRKLTSLPVNHVIVMLPPTVDARVVSQWHLLAANMQATLRISVITTPCADAGNIRGVIEVIAMKTGLNAWANGIDFATGQAVPCAQLATHIERNACDMIIDTGIAPFAENATIRMSHDADDAKQCDVWFRGGLCRGIAARVMRFDGSMLWLCDDPQSSLPDPTVELLKRIGDAL